MLSAAVAAALVWDAGARAEARSRAPNPDDATTGATGDLQLDPTLSISDVTADARALFAYTPRLLLAEPHSRRHLDVLHRGRLEGEWLFDRGARLRVTAAGAFGQQDFSPLVPGNQAPLDRPPPVASARYVQSDTVVSLQRSLSARVQLTAAAGYSLSGGADDAARASIPLQRGPVASATLALRQDRQDTISLSLSASHAAFRGGGATDGRSATVADSLVAWRSTLSRELSLELGGGLGALREQPPGADATLHALPVAMASVREEVALRGERLSAGLRLRAGPVIDRVDGSSYQRGEGGADVSWSPGAMLRFEGRASFARAVTSGPHRGESFESGEVGASYELGRRAVVTAGARASWQDEPGLNLHTFQWVAFASATVATGGGL